MRWHLTALGCFAPYSPSSHIGLELPPFGGRLSPSRTTIRLPLTQNGRAWRLVGYPEIQVDMSGLTVSLRPRAPSGRDLSDCVRDLSGSNWWKRQEAVERFCERTRERDRSAQCNSAQILAEVRTIS